MKTMKKMKTNFLTLAALLLAGAAVVSCSKDDKKTNTESQPAPVEAKTYKITVEAGKGGETRALADAGTTLTATWEVGDKVKVYNSASTELGELTAQTAGASTTLSGTLTTTPTDGETLTLKYLSASYGTQDGTLTGSATSLDKVCDYSVATVTASVSGETVTTTKATFVSQQAIVRFTLKDKADNSELSATQLVVTTGGETYTVTPSSAASELYVAVPAISSQALTLTATAGGKTYVYERASVTFENSKFYRITVKMTEKPDFLAGEFSVSGSKKVKFSKGNLRYASSKWSFFDNQYDYYTSYSAEAWDKFGWSTSANTYGMNTSTTSDDYSGDLVDWGATIGTGWFTLSKDEWTYLFDTRSASTVGGTSNGRYAKAKVNDVQGIILFPDTYTHPDGVTAPTCVNATGDTGWNDNNYSSADWTKMESAGCVFLPAAGYRNGSTVYGAGTGGYYWSATPNGTSSAYGVGFYSGYPFPAYYCDRDGGCSVRLVRQVE